jgi:phage terminase Nu1 subunit (DNA packaging protein)
MRSENHIADAIVDTREMAQFIDLKPLQVQRLTADGTLRESSQGQYHLQQNSIAYIRSLRARTQRDYSGEDEYMKLRNEKIATEHEITTLKLRQLKGELLERTHVMLVLTNVFAAVRNRILAIPSRCGRLVLGLKTFREVYDVLMREHELALNEMSEFDRRRLVRDYTSNGSNGNRSEKRKRKTAKRRR